MTTREILHAAVDDLCDRMDRLISVRTSLMTKVKQYTARGYIDTGCIEEVIEEVDQRVYSLLTEEEFQLAKANWKFV